MKIIKYIQLFNYIVTEEDLLPELKVINSLPIGILKMNLKQMIQIPIILIKKMKTII